MFQRLLTWIKGVFLKMIGKNTAQKAFNVEIAVSSKMAEALQLWVEMYTNEAPWLSDDIKSLNLPASIASEIATLVINEIGIEVTGGQATPPPDTEQNGPKTIVLMNPRAQYMQGVVDDQLLPKIREIVEYGAAKGGIILKPYIDQNNKLAIDIVQADQFFPVTFDAMGNLTACIFVDQRQSGNYWYTKLEYHDMASEGYVIRNLAYRSNTEAELGQAVPLESIADWSKLPAEAIVTDITAPLFAYFRYPLANNIDPQSKIGVSCYSRAIDLIKEADVQWSNLLWEFESGQRALYVDSLAFQKDAKGRPMLPNKRLYRTIETGSAEGDLFKEWTPTLREESILAGLDAILKKIEYACGLAYGTLSDPNLEAKTATEIKVSKQRTYATITSSQKALQTAIEQLLYAIDVLATLYKLAPSGVYEATYTFDDSIIVDTQTQFMQDLQLVTAGLMSKVEFRMRNFKESEEVATKKINDAAANTPRDLFAGA